MADAREEYAQYIRDQTRLITQHFLADVADRVAEDMASVAVPAYPSDIPFISRIEQLEKELAAEREKFTMHTAQVGAWLSALADFFDARGDDVQSTCIKIMDAAKLLKERVNG